MTVKYTYNGDYGLSIEAEHNSELTEAEAKLLIAKETAAALGALASAMADIAQAFEYKKFYDEDANHPQPPQPRKRKAKSKTARPKRKG